MRRPTFEKFIRSKGALAEGLARIAPPEWLGELSAWEEDAELEKAPIMREVPKKGRLVARVASVQTHVSFSNPKRNLERAFDVLHSNRKQEIDLYVFPECFLTGYCCKNRDSAFSIALNLDPFELGGWCIKVIRELAAEYKCTLVMGFAECEGLHLYNTAVVVTPKGEATFYRKVHLPELGFDKFATPGDQLLVVETPIGKVGVLICFDLRLPEAARSLALNGADLIVVPTNWPVGATVSANILTPARAAENKVFVISCNRVGSENGFKFMGGSAIVDVMGAILDCGWESPRVLVADIDLTEARKKRTITIPGKYETDVFATRRPDLYGRLTEHQSD